MDFSDFAIVMATFLLAGSIKGVVGLGLPIVSLSLLAVIFDLPSAMALLLLPSFVTNVWQASTGGHTKALLKRLWLFLGMATVTIGIGASALVYIDHAALSALLGAVIIAYSLLSLSGIRFTVSPQKATVIGFISGAINGLLTGMTGSSAVPGVMFLQALGLPRDMLIQAMGMLFSVSAVGLAVALFGNNFLSAELGLLSASAILPAVAGMMIGKKIRHRIPEEKFRLLFFSALTGLGAYILIRSI